MIKQFREIGEEFLDARPSALELWEVDDAGASHRRGVLRSSVAAAPLDDEVGVAHVHYVWFSVGNPYNLCFVAYHSRTGHVNAFSRPDEDPDPYYYRRNGIYQFGVVDEFAEVCARHAAGLRWMRRQEHSEYPDTPSLRPLPASADLCKHVTHYGTLSRSAIVHMDAAASGNCIAAVVAGARVIPIPQRQPTGSILDNVMQVVFYECPMRIDNPSPEDAFPSTDPPDRAFLNAGVLPITDNIHLHGPRPRMVRLSPCGDVAVVMFQAIHGGEWFVHVIVRVSPSTGFVVTRRWRLEDAIQDPLCETAPTLGQTRPLPPRRCVRTLPSSFAFSPCGRFLLMAFAFNQDNVIATMRSCKPGLCILDLCNAWSSSSIRSSSGCSSFFGHTVEEHRDAAWIDCRSDLLPQRMVWNAAGLWLLARRGVLLLGL